MSEEKKYKYKKPVYSFKNEDDIITFGINKGMTILDAMIKDTGYIEWCLKNMKNFKLSKKLSLKFDDIRKS